MLSVLNGKIAVCRFSETLLNVIPARSVLNDLCKKKILRLLLLKELAVYLTVRLQFVDFLKRC